MNSTEANYRKSLRIQKKCKRNKIYEYEVKYIKISNTEAKNPNYIFNNVLCVRTCPKV